jgi:hypothetical protein
LLEPTTLQTVRVTTRMDSKTSLATTNIKYGKGRMLDNPLESNFNILLDRDEILFGGLGLHHQRDTAGPKLRLARVG